MHVGSVVSSAAEHDLPLVHCGAGWRGGSGHCYGKISGTLGMVFPLELEVFACRNDYLKCLTFIGIIYFIIISKKSEGTLG